MSSKNKGVSYIVSGPAGSGKTTLIDRLHREFPEMIKNISYTTRPRRPDEIEGIDYFFIEDDAFEAKVKQGEFLEHIQLFGYKYGTSRKWIEKKLEEGFSVFLIIDIQGARTIRAQMEITSIFIKPPSLDALKERLLRRNTDSEQIAARIARAQVEMEGSDEYDYQIVNDDLQLAYQELKHIIGV